MSISLARLPSYFAISLKMLLYGRMSHICGKASARGEYYGRRQHVIIRSPEQNAVVDICDSTPMGADRFHEDVDDDDDDERRLFFGKTGSRMSRRQPYSCITQYDGIIQCGDEPSYTSPSTRGLSSHKPVNTNVSPSRYDQLAGNYRKQALRLLMRHE